MLPQTLINQDLQPVNMDKPLELQRYLGVVTNPNITISASMAALLDMLGLKLTPRD